jgi:hypothetical protein
VAAARPPPLARFSRREKFRVRREASRPGSGIPSGRIFRKVRFLEKILCFIHEQGAKALNDELDQISL